MSFPRNKDDNRSDLVQIKFNEAVAEHQAGRTLVAERLYKEVLNAHPEHFAALYRLGVLYFQNEQPEKALPFLELALNIEPQNPSILSTLGVVSQMAGNNQNAVMYQRRALEIEPSDAGILKNLARTLREQGAFGAALEYYLKVAEVVPSTPDLYIDIGRCYFEMGGFTDAITCFEKALAQKPDYIEALGALSTVLWAVGRSDEAKARLQQAIQMAPNDAKSVLNFGEFLAFDEGKIDEALGYFNRALALAPTYINAAWRKSFALLARGEYREGWKIYAECLGNRETRGLNLFAPMKPWDGTPDHQKSLLIWCEQGLGDSLQFIRYAQMCKERVGKVSVFCDKPLVNLFKDLPYIDDASNTYKNGSFDAHVPIMNLPHVFETVLETIPSDPYVSSLPAINAKWATRFVGREDEFKVGIVWAGGAHEDKIIPKLTNLQRSIHLERIRSWLNLPGIIFYSLQKDKPAEQIAELGLQNALINYMDEVSDFTDTAAIVHHLDLVITVDTAVAHLAGSMGKPVWIMSRYNADWRWLKNQPSSPWYPSARIFGQPRMGDWDSVIANIGAELSLERERRMRNLKS